MALIVEVVSGRGQEVRTRVRVGDLPLTVGRGYDNELILDDPYVDARHARIVPVADGKYMIEDLGSVNGLIGIDNVAVTRVELKSGTSVRIGRTTLRVRHTGDEVAPTLRENSVRVRSVSPLTLNKWSLLGIVLLGMLVIALSTWLGSYERESLSGALETAVGFIAIGFLWAGAWAIASRVVLHRAHFLMHAAIFAAMIILITIQSSLTTLFTFLTPTLPIGSITGTVFGLILFAAMLTAHLAFTSHMSLQRRAWISLSIGVVIFAFGTMLDLTESREFSDVPKFTSVLKPVDPRLVPASTPAEFRAQVEAFKSSVDEIRQESE